jgi:hypothetical protein
MHQKLRGISAAALQLTDEAKLGHHPLNRPLVIKPFSTGLTDMDDHSLQLRVTYEDFPDLIELGVRVIHGEWSTVATACTSPSAAYHCSG